MVSRLLFAFGLIGAMAVISAPAQCEDSEEMDGHEVVNINAELLFLDLFSLRAESPNHVQTEVLSVPLVAGRAQILDEDGVEVHEGEVPLFRLSQLEQRGEGNFHCDFLELPFSAVYRGDWEGKSSHWEFLDLPLVTTLTHSQGENSWMWGLVDGPVVSAFHADTSEESADVRLLDLCLASAFDYDRDSEGHEWEVLDIPLITVLQGGRTQDGANFTLLDPPIFRSLFKLTPDLGEALFLIRWTR